MIKKLAIFFILAACCRPDEQNIINIAMQHEEVLRHHFKGHRAGDVSSLINRTKEISYSLKRAGLLKAANRFDSYTDVLIYGNRTLNESMQDVLRLVKCGFGRTDYSYCIPSLFNSYCR